MTTTATKTPAEISAEVADAHHTEFAPTLHLDEIRPHPRNIRHDAVADDEMVASIEEIGVLEPLIVAPAGDGDGYVLIAGHRRLDGCHKAGRTSAPAIVRLDLTDEADQVAAMLVENGRRKDLTPLEEAEGYGQLRFDFGWKPGAIAKAAGHNVDTINKRLKLLKLDGKVQKNLDEGQLTIEDAIAISELPKTEQTKVSRSAGTASFKWDLSQAKERVRRQAATDALVAKLDSAGVPRRDMPAATSAWLLNHADHGMTLLSNTFSRSRDDHLDCLAFVLVTNGGATAVEYVCTDVPAHDEQLDEKRRTERQAAEQEAREDEEREAAERIARQLRIDTVRSSIKPGLKLDPALAGLLRVLTHALLSDELEYSYTCAEIYFDTLGVAEDDRWGIGRLWDEGDRARFRAHVDKQLHGTPAQLLQTFTAVTAAILEGGPVNEAGVAADTRTLKPREDLNVVAAWLDLAEQAGHAPTPVDVGLRELTRCVDEEPSR